MAVWTPVLSVLHACVLYFCICTCPAQLSMFHMERRSRNMLIIIIIIIIVIIIINDWLVAGTFQNIEHVFIVGVAGGVPQFADYFRHPRLGDIVLSKTDDRNYLYYHCDKMAQVGVRAITWDRVT